MILNIVWLVVGLILILIGANALTDGASALAKRMGISDLIVGLTVVAFGTSAPELAISVISASAGNAPLAIGNVVGSNIFNILIIIGVTAIVRPIVVSRNIMTLEIPMLILSSVILLVLGNSAILDGGINQVSRVSAIFLLIFFLLFMRYTFASAKQPDLSQTEAQQAAQKKPMALAKSMIYVVVGLAALVWGGDKFVEGASGIASGLGVSDAVIGLTIVAAGTSLPELATSIVAAVKGKPELAVGNVIGSNIFNVVVVLGISGVITPLPFGSIGNFDLLTLLGASLTFYLFGWIIKTRTITRLEGAILAAGYIAYVGILLSRL
ncbi:MAG: calcium/sodium antiporter [Muribaculaceae bacterium]|nr:calcium/sodium antiporter [Muribaculaceae bacterium]